MKTFGIWDLKRVLKELEAHGESWSVVKSPGIGNYTIEVKYEFKDKMVTATINNDDLYENSISGKAICDDEDKFSLSYGVRLSTARLVKEYILKNIQDHKNFVKHSNDKIETFKTVVSRLNKSYKLNKESRS